MEFMLDKADFPLIFSVFQVRSIVAAVDMDSNALDITAANMEGYVRFIQNKVILLQIINEITANNECWERFIIFMINRAGNPAFLLYATTMRHPAGNLVVYSVSG